jgi:tetrahydromethanopterin S-methyltransferase subunit C
MSIWPGLKLPEESPSFPSVAKVNLPSWYVEVESPVIRSFTSALGTGVPASSVTVPLSVNADAVVNAVASTIGNTEKIALFIIYLLLQAVIGSYFLALAVNNQYKFQKKGIGMVN